MGQDMISEWQANIVMTVDSRDMASMTHKVAFSMYYNTIYVYSVPIRHI